MKQKQVEDFRFFFKDESIVMVYNRQFTCFHAFNDRNKSHLKYFGKRIKHAKRMDINKLYGLVREYKVDSFLTTGGDVKNVIEGRPIQQHNIPKPKHRILW